MQDKEAQITKIQNLLESNDTENITLAFQLMEGLDLTKEVLSLYGLDYITNYSISFKLNSYKSKIGNLSHLLIEYLLGFWNINGRDRLIHSVLVLLTNMSYKKIKVPESQGKYHILLNKELVQIKAIIIVETSDINKEVLEIEELNLLTRKELKQAYMNKIKSTTIHSTHWGHIPLIWIDIRRRTRNPITYQIKPYEEKQEYSIFTVIAKVTL